MTRHNSRSQSLTTIAGLALLAPASAFAQELRGIVRQADGATPASGVIIVVQGATRDSIVARAVTGTRGVYSVRVPAGVPVRVEARRVGFLPMPLGTFTIAAGAARVVDVALVDQPVVLDAVDVREASRCDVRPDSARAVARLYDEAQKAMLASVTIATGERSIATTTLFTRVENLRGRVVQPIRRTMVSGPTTRPFASISADSLAVVGYVTEESDGTVYRAPDANVLLSDRFASAHCLQYADGKDERASSVGVAFRPMTSRKSYVDIRGTMWLDRSTLELQAIEFTYEGIPKELQRGRVGGLVEFARTADGGWLVNRWAIRMPRIVQRTQEGTRSISGGTVSGFAPIEAVVDTIIVTGGEVQSVRVEGELLYASAATISADEPDPRNANTTAASPRATGPSTLMTFADTVTVTSSCEGGRDAAYRGVVQGRVIDGARAPLVGATVTAEWKQDFRNVGGHDWAWEYRTLATTTLAGGRYVLCGAPIDRVVTVSAAMPDAEAKARGPRTPRSTRGPVVRMSARDPRATLELMVGAPAAVAAGRASMVRVTDAAGNPVAFASVRVAGANARVTDRDGRVIAPVSGQDSLDVDVRRVGFTPYAGKVGRGADADFVVPLERPSQRLAAVRVQADVSPLERTGFYDRMLEVQRGAIVGEFITPEELEFRGGARLSQLLAATRYVKVIYVAPDSNTSPSPVLVGRNSCIMNVFLDGVRVTNLNTGAGMGADNIDGLVTATSVSAIEVYPSAALVPTRFVNGGFGGRPCGVVALWTGSRQP